MRAFTGPAQPEGPSPNRSAVLNMAPENHHARQPFRCEKSQWPTSPSQMTSGKGRTFQDLFGLTGGRATSATGVSCHPALREAEREGPSCDGGTAALVAPNALTSTRMYSRKVTRVTTTG